MMVAGKTVRERLITKLYDWRLSMGWDIRAGYPDLERVTRYGQAERLKSSDGSPGDFGKETGISLIDRLGCKSKRWLNDLVNKKL